MNGPGAETATIWEMSDGSWSLIDTINPGFGAALKIACPSVSTCYALVYTSSPSGDYSLLTTTNGGTTWSQSTPPLTYDGYDVAFACPTTSTCYAANLEGIIQTTNGGTSWTSESSGLSGNQYSFNSMSCPNASTCFIAGELPPYQGNILATSNGGATWTAEGSLQLGLISISCASTAVCVAAGDADIGGVESGEYQTTTDGGTTWAVEQGASGDFVTGVSCPSTADCYASAYYGYVDNGSNYDEGVVETTGDTGADWSVVSVPYNVINDLPANYTVQGLSCASPTTCEAYGTDWNYAAADAYFGPPPYAPPVGTIAPPELIGGGGGLEPGTDWQGNGVDPETGDVSESATDFSVPTFGPSLSFTRTYDAQLAQAEATASTPGPLGNGWIDNWSEYLSISPTTQVVTVTQANGSQSQFAPPAGGSCTPPDYGPGTAGTYCAFPRVVGSLTYDSTNDTYSLVLPDGTTYGFTSTDGVTASLTSIKDANSLTETISYDSPSPGAGNCPSTAASCETIQAASGRTLTLGWSAAGNLGVITSVTDPMDRTVTYSYDAHGNLSSVTDPISRVTSYTYDESNSNSSLVDDLLTTTYPNGQSGGPDAGTALVNAYDSSGRAISQTDPLGRSTTYNYANLSSPGNGSVVVSDPNGNETQDVYLLGELTQQTTAYNTAAAATSYYNTDPDTLESDLDLDPNGAFTSSTYDASADQLTSTDGLGNTSSYAYDSLAEQSCAASPESPLCSTLSPPAPITAGTPTITPPSAAPPPFVTYSEYDTNGNLIWTTTGAYQPGSSTASYSRTTYNLYNGESVTLGSNNDSCATTAPADSLPCATIDANGVVTQLAYDAGGDLTSSSTPDGNAGGELATTTHTYDGDGEVLTTVSPDGNLAGANAANYTTTNVYNADREVTSTTLGASGATVLPRTTGYSYDGDGNLISTSRSDSIRLVGTTAAHGLVSSLTLNLPPGTVSSDEVVLATTTSPLQGIYPLQFLTADNVTTLAGTGTAGTTGDNGQASEALLKTPSAVVADSSGNLYIADKANNRVQEIAATTHTQWGISMTAGDVYTIAGSSAGTSGHTGDGGAATSALLYGPTGVALDAAGNLYIADTTNNRIQFVAAASCSSSCPWGLSSTTAKDIYTIAGSSAGTSGKTGDGGAATSALLSAPTGVALDSSGNLYISDKTNNRIQFVAAASCSSSCRWGLSSTTANYIYTVAGSSAGTSGKTGDGGAATSALLSAPTGVALDSSGNLYIADTTNNRIQFVAATSCSSSCRWGLSSTTANYIYTVAGSSAGTSGHTGDSGAATSALLYGPAAVALDPSGNLYIADSTNNRIQEVAASGGTQWGQSMTANDIYTVAGSSSGSSGSSGDGGAATSALLSGPAGIVLDASGNLYIADATNNKLREVASGALPFSSLTADNVTTLAGTGTAGTTGDNGQASEALLKTPSAVVADSSGNLYIADKANNRVQEIAATTHTQWGISMTAGDVYTIAGSSAGTSGHTGDGGAATSALLYGPTGVALDAAGNLYIADTTNNRIQFVAAASCSSSCPWGLSSTTAKDIYTIAGSSAGTSGKTGDGGAATSALLSAPTGVALDSSGNLYISDKTNNRIQFVAAASCSSSCRWGLSSTTANYIYTVAGSSAGTSGKTGDGGAATSALLSGPTGVALDSSGNLYIADTTNNRIQFVAAASCSSSCRWGLSSTTANYIYTVAGSSAGTSGHTGDSGAATSALLYGPAAVALDPSGNLYIADSTNNRIQEVAASGGTQWGQSMTANDIYTVAGSSSGSSGSSGDGGAATSALLSGPAGIVLDASGNLYIADATNNKLREVASGATPVPEAVTTPAGYGLVASPSTGSTSTYVLDHRVGSGDTSVTVQYASTAPVSAVLAVYADVSTTPIDASASATTASGTSVSAPSITTTSPGDQLVVVSGGGQANTELKWSAPSGFENPITDATLSNVATLLATAPGPNPAGSTGAEVTGASSTSQLATAVLALLPGTATATSGTSYDADNEPVISTDASGNSSLTCYDGDGHVVETVPPVGVAANALTAASCAASTLYPSGYESGGVEYPPAALASDATLTTYDTLGEKLTVTTPAPAGQSTAQTTTYTYDPAGRVTQVSAPPASDVNGAADQITTYTYDAADELSSTTTGSGTAEASTTSTCYDQNGDVTATVPGDGNTGGVAVCSDTSPWQTSSSYQTGYSYDSLGELVSTTAPATAAAPSGATATYSYDAVGNQISSTDPNGVTTTSTYTPLDQLASLSYSGSSAHSVSYTYDASGNKVAMTDASGSSSYSYDPFSELTSVTNGAGKTVSYAYDALGGQISITYPLGTGATWASSQTVSRGYDEAGNLTSVSDFNGDSVAITNTADGLPSSMALGGSGATLSTTYDAADEQAAISLTKGSTVLGFSYSRSPSGAIASETDTPSSSRSPAGYSYDPLSRVTQMTPGTTGALNYSYDASSNLTTLPTGATASYDNGSELISSTLSSTTTTYTYNADGQLTAGTGSPSTAATASWNGAGELTSYSDAAANTSSATYDGDGVRSSSTTTPTGGSASTQNFVWNTTSSVPSPLADSTSAYIYGPSGTPIEQVNLSSGAVTYLIADSLGSVRGVLSSTGSLTASTAYDAYGNPEAPGGLAAYTPVGFAGGYTDPTGLVYLVDRYYDPQTGQFLSVDPLVAATQQAYVYSSDDPVSLKDPTGRDVVRSYTINQMLGIGAALVEYAVFSADVIDLPLPTEILSFLAALTTTLLLRVAGGCFSCALFATSYQINHHHMRRRPCAIELREVGPIPFGLWIHFWPTGKHWYPIL